MAGGRGGGYKYNGFYSGGQGGSGYNGQPGADGGATYTAGNGNKYGGGGGGGGAGGGTGGNGTYSDGTVTGTGGTAGQAGADTTTAGVGGGGGGGGGANGTLLNGFTGGAGGKGGQGNYGGGGGAGGYGYVTGTTTPIPNAGTITGGAGGAGGAGVDNPNGGLSGYGGSGGDGGTGVFVTQAGSTFTNTAEGTITGGAGGAGGSGNAATGAGGVGGAGIGGVSGVTIDNSGDVTGGAGAAGGSNGFFNSVAAGGAGIDVTGSTVTNTGGQITGGTGGVGGDGIDGGDGSTIRNETGSVLGGGVDEGAIFGSAGAGIVVGETSSVVVDGGSVAGGVGGGFGGLGGAGIVAGDTSSVTVNGGTVDGGASAGSATGGAGIVASKASVTGGAVTGGSGSAGGAFFSTGGGAGGVGITDRGNGGGGIPLGAKLAAEDSTTSTFDVSGGTVTGGSGGAGAAGTGGARGGYGGQGGAGIAGTGMITGNGTITGGSGGQGGSSDTGTGGPGGIGGNGIYAANSTVTTSGTIAGGIGGAGGDNTSGTQGNGGNGGNGGSGIAGYASSVTVQNGSSVTGGAGGNSGNVGTTQYSYGGIGGAGVSNSGMTLVSDGTIAGGRGGDGAYGGGSGGSGVDAGDSSFVTINSGSVTGGDGGAGTYGGNGGVGVAGSNLTLVTNGTISGGMGGMGAMGATGSEPKIESAAFTSDESAADAAAATPVQADAVQFTGGNNTLALGSNAQFNGAIDLQNKSSVTFDQNVVDGLPADATVSTNIIGNGSVIKFGEGTLTFSGVANSYSGGTTINAGTLDLDSQGAAGTGAIAFRAASSTGTRLDLETSAQNVGGTFGNTLSYFDAGDSVDIKGFAFNSMTSTITPTNNSFVVTNATGQTQTFDLSRSSTQTYYAHDDGNGGTLVDTNAPCYVTGTSIRTARGDVAVEALVVGDLVVTSRGEHRPIRWLGHRTIDCARHSRPHEAHPVRIAAHAFGENRPARDLLVSPGHAICVDVVGEVLIPAVVLVNGSTVQQVEVDEVTYWHVELDSHDVLLAENLPAESYLDMGNRGFFSEAGVVDFDASPDAGAAARTHADFCRPFHDGGAMVEVVRAQLRRRAEAMGWTIVGDPTADMHLRVDGVRIEPQVRGASARFAVPASAADVWLVSRTGRPCDTMDVVDGRRLGLFVGALTISDGFAPREVALGDPLLCVGFHGLEPNGRWTTGEARLPAELWQGCEDGFYLRVDLATSPIPRWACPEAARPALALVA